MEPLLPATARAGTRGSKTLSQRPEFLLDDHPSVETHFSIHRTSALLPPPQRRADGRARRRGVLTG